MARRSKYKSNKGMERVGVLFIVSVILIIIIPVMLYFLAPADKKVEKIASIVATPTPIPQQRVLLPPQVQHIYTGDKFRINFPQDWEVYDASTEGLESIVIKPYALPKDDFLPSVQITVSENREHPYLSERQAYYKSFGFKEATLNVGRYLATELRGKFPLQGTSENTHQEVRIFFDENGYGYLIMFKYPGAEVNQEYENILLDIIATFNVGE